MRSARGLLIGACAVLAFAGAAQAVTVKQIEDGLVRYMNDGFKCTGLKVVVQTFDDPQAVQEGHLKLVHITVTRADFEGITMHELSLKAYDVKLVVSALLEQNKLLTNRAKNMTMHARFTEAEMNEALKTKKMPIQSFQVHFQDGKLVATGTHRFLVGNQLKMIAHLEPKDDGVHLVAEKVWVNGLPLPVGQLKKIIDKMNPLINLERLPFHPKAKTITIHEQDLEVS